MNVLIQTQKFCIEFTRSAIESLHNGDFLASDPETSLLLELTHHLEYLSLVLETAQA